LQESKLINKPLPEYPAVAQRMRLSGTVILLVTIDEEGNVTDIKPQSGHPLLQTAAIAAVKKWKYSPTVLNGEPISIIGTVKVIFNSKVQ
jgi:protein TonB